MTKLIAAAASAALTLGLPVLIPFGAQAQSPHYGESHNAPYNAHEACKKNEDKRQILGGLAGAVVGGVFGSQVSGNGARSEGSAIGAVLGGLAGAGIADKTVDCDPVYDERGQGYQSSPTSYPAGYGGQTYGTTYSGGSTVHQPVYTDQVTYSNHPVYSQPTYGAGAVNYGTTHNTGTVTYPPYTQPQPRQAPRTQSYTVSSPTYSGSYGSSYPQYRTVPATPAYHTTTYRRPVSRTTVRHSGRRHYHGSYACIEPH